MATQAAVKEKLLAGPAEFLRQEIRDFARTSPDNRLAFLDGYRMFDDPLVNFADAADPLFDRYKELIGPVHYTPREALAEACGRKPEDLPARLSVISWILPITEETRRSNRKETTVPSRLWSHTRWYGEAFNNKVREHVTGLLTGAGYLAAAPMTQPYFKGFFNDKGMYSNWSERHVAYAAGLGTFSLSDGFITEAGIAHRCGSVVTDLALPPSPRDAATPFSNCLFYVEVKCRSCIERCPAGAISEQGHDKNKCRDYLNKVGYDPRRFKTEGYDNDKSVAGCGLCQTKVPCEYLNPTRKLKKKAS